MRRFKNIFEQKGISPVIGVILLVALTIALISLITLLVFNIDSDSSSTVDASIQIDETESGIQVSVLRNSNVDSILLSGPNEEKSISSPVGENIELNDSSGKYSVIAILSDGTEQLLYSNNVETEDILSGGDETVEGTVSTNPLIPGAEVVAIEDGEIVDEQETNSDGFYELNVNDLNEAEINVQVNGVIEIQGLPFFAEATQEVNGRNVVNFRFELPEQSVIDNLEDRIESSDLAQIDLNTKIDSNEISQGETFEITGDINNAYDIELSEPLNESTVSVGVNSTDLNTLNIDSTNNEFTSQVEATEIGMHNIIVEAEDSTGTIEQNIFTVEVTEEKQDITEREADAVETVSVTNTCTVINVDEYNSAIIEASAGAGGESSGFGGTDNGEGGLINVIADISDIDELCVQVGEQGEGGSTGFNDGGIGYESGKDSFATGIFGNEAQSNSGGGGGSTIVADNDDITGNFIVAAAGGGGGSGEPQGSESGGDGGDSEGSASGGSGGSDGISDGSDGTVDSGSSVTEILTIGTNDADGEVVLELYK